MEVITENSAISIGLLVTISGFIGGGIVWLTKLHSLASGNRVTLEATLRRLNQLEEESHKTSERMARIETKLDIILETLKR